MTCNTYPHVAGTFRLLFAVMRRPIPNTNHFISRRKLRQANSPFTHKSARTRTGQITHVRADDVPAHDLARAEFPCAAAVRTPAIDRGDNTQYYKCVFNACRHAAEHARWHGRQACATPRATGATTAPPGCHRQCARRTSRLACRTQLRMPHGE